MLQPSSESSNTGADIHWTGVHKRIKAGLSDCEPDVRRKILWDNGQKLYKVEDPKEEDLKRLAAAT